MKKKEARGLVRSLIGRLNSEDGFWQLPDARLSPQEVVALELLSGSGTQGTVAEVMVTKVAQASPTDANTNTGLISTRIEINRSALENYGPPENEIRLCIDFGTAMSKACATRRVEDDVIPLRLGRAVEGSDTWSVPSSLYISESGTLYFGNAAERQYRSSSSNGQLRKRFDDIKYMLSEREPNSNLYDIRLPTNIDPTGKVTYGDALLLYLAWLTDHACKALIDARPLNGSIEEALSLRYVKRRFAIPCFESADDERTRGPERAIWARQVIRESMAHAQIIADTFSDKWSELTVEDALLAIAQCRETVDVRGIEHLLAKRSDIREPIAAGASQFSEQVEQGNEVRQRRSLLVVDAGAGTTDFALFNVATALGHEVRYSLVDSSVKMYRSAGNRVDRVLRAIIVEKCGIDRNNLGAQDYDHANTDLDSQIRDIKQQLFQNGTARFNIRPGIDGEVKKMEIEQHADYIDLGEFLHDLRNRIIEASIREENKVFGQHATLFVDVLLTGGSSALPIFQMLATGTHEVKGWKVNFQRVSDEWIEYLVDRYGQEILNQYPQLAVAIGGAAPECPEEIRGTAGMILPTLPGERQITPIYRGQ